MKIPAVASRRDWAGTAGEAFAPFIGEMSWPHFLQPHAPFLHVQSALPSHGQLAASTPVEPLAAAILGILPE